MNNYIKLILGIAAFAAIIAGAVFAYTNLANNTNADNILIFGQPNPTQEEDYLGAEYESEAHSQQPGQANDVPTRPMTTAPQQQNTAQAQPAPDFTLFDADGNQMQLSDFFGKPIILNFWASWCPACVGEMPYFEELYQNYGDYLHVLKINLLDGTRETRDRVDQFMYTGGYTFPLFFDYNNSGARAYGINSIPITFFIDENGYATAMASGGVNNHILQQGLSRIGL